MPESRAARAWLAAGLLALGAALPGHPLRAAGTFDLAELTATLAQARSGMATFTEERSVSVLDRPLESSGRIWFEAPDTFVRETLKPRHERLAVVGNKLTMSQGQRSRTVALDASPEAGVIVEAIRGTLTGNREALERQFATRVSGSAERWTLDMEPREARLRGQVASVRITGRQSQVREIVLLLADGDRSVMTIEPTTALPPSGLTPAPAAAASAVR